MPEFPEFPVSSRSPIAPAKRGHALIRASAAAAIAVMVALPAVLPVLAAPGAARCEIPARAQAAAATATPAPRSDSTPAAAARAATPAATPVAAGSAAAVDPATADFEAVAGALAACLTKGDAEGVADLATVNWLGSYFGGGTISRDQFIALAPELGLVPMEVRSVENAKVKGSAATADVEYVIGRQLSRATWSFVKDASATPRQTPWRVDGESPLTVDPPAGAEEIEVTLGENLLALSDDAAKGGDLVLRGENTGAADHEMVVLKFAEGFGLPDLLRSTGPGLPGQAEWIGQATVPVGGDATLVLTDLTPGTYWVLCLFPNPDGSLHAGAQEAAAFTVE